LKFISPLFENLQGNELNGLRSGSDLSNTRAVYKCWFGLELEPIESETRYCVEGKWTGENPQCGVLFFFKLFLI